MSGGRASVEGMDGSGVGSIQQGLLDAARVLMVERRRGYHRMLSHIAALEGDGVAVATGYQSTVRLVEDLWRLDGPAAGGWSTRPTT